MSEPDPRAIRFYFSFRSPYAWLAAERLDAELGDLGVRLELVGIYPTGDFVPAATADKLAYLVQDVARLVRERGLRLRFPPAGDPDWSLSHAAFLHAQGRGAGERFMREAFRQRFVEGRDLGEDGVIAAAAERAGLAADEVVAAAHSGELRALAGDAWRRAAESDHVFGVPSFVYAGKLYWGQDRMHFLRSAVMRKSGTAD
jgi:2-hydroxychromene-2-carboxylate isomerase